MVVHFSDLLETIFNCSTCYTSELQSFCSGKGGQVWNDFFCILPSEYTVVGPVCFGPLCQTGSVDSVCPNVGGSNLASRWCLIPGGGKTVVGPFCFGDSIAGCSQLAAQDSCSHLSGTLFGNLLCLVNGVHSVLGVSLRKKPNVYKSDYASPRFHTAFVFWQLIQ